LANQGITNSAQLGAICTREANGGISISTFGVGLDYNEDLMMALAECGSGNYYFINSPDEIPTIFAKELKGLLSVAAQNVALRIETGDGVAVDTVVGYRHETQKGRTIVMLGDLFSNEKRSIVVRLTVPPKAKDSLLVARAQISYADVVSGNAPKTLRQQCSLRYTSDSTLVAKNLNAYVAQNVDFMLSNVNMQNAAQMVEDGKYKEARDYLAKEVLNVQRSANQYQSLALKKQLLSVYKYKESIEDYEKLRAEQQKLIQKRSKFKSYESLKSK